jgi:predicted nuclease of predicted toxin-antitoxin system
VRFLVDECTGPRVAAWLHSQGHEVFSVFDDARGIEDEEVIQKAYAESWILITNDKDFGEKVYRERRPHRGVILMRLEDERPANKIEVLQRLLEAYADRLVDSFVVVTDMHVRFAQVHAPRALSSTDKDTATKTGCE